MKALFQIRSNPETEAFIFHVLGIDADSLIHLLHKRSTYVLAPTEEY